MTSSTAGWAGDGVNDLSVNGGLVRGSRLGLAGRFEGGGSVDRKTTCRRPAVNQDIRERRSLFWYTLR